MTAMSDHFRTIGSRADPGDAPRATVPEPSPVAGTASALSRKEHGSVPSYDRPLGPENYLRKINR